MYYSSSKPVPKSWSPKDKFSYIGLSKGNLRVHYRVISDGASKDGASVRSSCPIPAACGLFYFEIKILSKVRDNGVSLGLTPLGSSLSSLPGFEKNTFGYYGLEGTLHSGSKTGRAYGPPFNNGDVVGCGVNFIDNTCFFTKNGLNLGVAFTELPSNLYATVGLRSVNALVEANFGQTPFVFDLVEMKSEMGRVVKNSIMAFPVSESVGDRFDLEKVVSSYLLHHGYCDTAQSFASAIGQEIKGEVDSVKNRQRIIKLVLAGRITEAMELTKALHPGLLEDRPDLHFFLRVRQFIEVVAGNDTLTTDEPMEVDCRNGFEPHNGINGEAERNRKLERILECGRQLYSFSQAIFNEYGMCEVNRCRMRDAFSLMAYADPKSSPVGWQLDPSEREVLSHLLNSAILETANVSRKAPLEKAFTHAKELLRLMSDAGIGSAAFVSFEDLLN